MSKQKYGYSSQHRVLIVISMKTNKHVNIKNEKALKTNKGKEYKKVPLQNDGMYVYQATSNGYYQNKLNCKSDNLH